MAAITDNQTARLGSQHHQWSQNRAGQGGWGVGGVGTRCNGGTFTAVCAIGEKDLVAARDLTHSCHVAAALTHAGGEGTAELHLSPSPPSFPALSLGPLLALLIREDLIFAAVLCLQEKSHSDPPTTFSFCLPHGFARSILDQCPDAPGTQFCHLHRMVLSAQLLALQPRHHGVKQPAWLHTGVTRRQEWGWKRSMGRPGRRHFTRVPALPWCERSLFQAPPPQNPLPLAPHLLLPYHLQSDLRGQESSVARHDTLAGQPPSQGQPRWLPSSMSLAQAGCSPILLPAASAESEGGEQGESLTALKSRCCSLSL